MELIKKRYKFTNADGKEIGYYRFFLRENGVSFEVAAPLRYEVKDGNAIRVPDPNVRALLKAFAKDETPETEEPKGE